MRTMRKTFYGRTRGGTRHGSVHDRWLCDYPLLSTRLTQKSSPSNVVTMHVRTDTDQHLCMLCIKVAYGVWTPSVAQGGTAAQR